MPGIHWAFFIKMHKQAGKTDDRQNGCEISAAIEADPLPFTVFSPHFHTQDSTRSWRKQAHLNLIRLFLISGVF